MILIMSGMLERSRKGQLILALRGTQDPDRKLALVREHLGPIFEPYVEAEEQESLYRSATRCLDGAVLERIRPHKDEVLGALATAWLVFVASVPAVLPFLFMDDRFLALRTSNALLLCALFLVGYRWSVLTNSRPWVVGGSLMLTGLVMVLIAIPLGG
jgi:VIT1/CCC1 family predicted Fe2+/Mn2+ transporter